MKLYSPGNCLCSVGYFWNTGNSAPNPGETGNVAESIYGFCTGSLLATVLTPSQSSPLGVDTEGKKVLYRRGSTQEIWTRDFVGTTAALYTSGDLYDNSIYIRDIIYNESLGYSSVYFQGLAPFSSSVASFDNGTGDFVEGPYQSGSSNHEFHSTDSSGNIYTAYPTTLIEVKAFKNGAEYAVLNDNTTSEYSYSTGFTVIGSDPYIVRAPYPTVGNQLLYFWTKIVNGGGQDDHDDLYQINSLGSPITPATAPGGGSLRQRGKRGFRAYYNNATQLIDLAATIYQVTEEEGETLTLDIIRFNLGRTRNSNIVTNWVPGPHVDSFVFKDG